MREMEKEVKKRKKEVCDEDELMAPFVEDFVADHAMFTRKGNLRCTDESHHTEETTKPLQVLDSDANVIEMHPHWTPPGTYCLTLKAKDEQHAHDRSVPAEQARSDASYHNTACDDTKRVALAVWEEAFGKAAADQAASDSRFEVMHSNKPGVRSVRMPPQATFCCADRICKGAPGHRNNNNINLVFFENASGFKWWCMRCFHPECLLSVGNYRNTLKQKPELHSRLKPFMRHGTINTKTGKVSCAKW